MRQGLLVPASGLRLSERSIEQLAWAGWFIGFAALSAVSPRDADFDVLHYHLHNGWSALYGRFHHDLAPAEMHSFLNPTYNVVVWWLIEHLPGPAVAFLLDLVQAAILPVLYVLCRRFSRAVGEDMGAGLAIVLAVLGFFCAPAWTSFASIRNDDIGALAFLAGLALLLPGKGEERPSRLSLILAAACVGFGAGLKLTNIIYVPAFAVFALVLSQDWKQRAQHALVCAGAGAAAFILVAGPWMAVLWQEFGNPIFPKFASAFPGPDAATEASRDTRYLPANLFEALSLPVRASVEGRYINEGAVFDLRLGLSYLSALYLAGLALGRRSVSRPAVALALGTLTLIAVWIGLFSIMRYAMAVWMLAPLLAWTAWKSAGLAWPAARNGRLLFAGLSLALVATTSAENVRRIGWESSAESYVEVQPPAAMSYDGALIFIAAEFPAAFTATAFPEARLTHIDAQEWSAPFLANYRRRIEAVLDDHEGPIYLVYCQPDYIDKASGRLVDDLYTAEKALMGDGEKYGLRLTPDGCREIETSFSTEFTTWQICPLERS